MYWYIFWVGAITFWYYWNKQTSIDIDRKIEEELKNKKHKNYRNLKPTIVVEHQANIFDQLVYLVVIIGFILLVII